MRALIATIIILFFAIPTFAQQKTVTGTVKNKGDNTPIANATVLVKGTSTGTQTNANGTYTITVPSDSSALVVSYVGFQTTEMPTTGTTQVDFVLNQLPLELNQVVVVGYTSQRKQDLTGAVAVVEMTPAVKNNTSGN